MKKLLALVLLGMIALIAACTIPENGTNGQNGINDDNGEPTGDFVVDLLQAMTLEEKIGQMLQAEEKHITPEEVTSYNIGSILSGGGSHPHRYDDDVDVWYDMVKTYQEAALASSSKIPLLYGTDAVHGHNNVWGATIFPHNINLGMMNNADLVRQVGEATALEMLTTGIRWNFSPAVSVARDIRWGRTYEAFSENPVIHDNLVQAYVDGLQSHGAIATAKHFVADGGTSGGIDQGNAVLSEADIRALHLPPFIEAIEAGVETIMVSFSSINGLKMHASHYWLTTVLKEELGFEGLVLSDWNATFQLAGDFQTQLVTAVNAGVDMLMLPQDWKAAHGELLAAVEQGLISEARIDDAVRRILSVKYDNGLFSDPYYRLDPAQHFATEDHKALARQAARESMVLLENSGVLPLRDTEKIYLTGPGSDHVGYLSGGWTTHWQGNTQARLGTGTSILAAIEDRLESKTGHVVATMAEADIVVVVFTETPYAEGHGDTPEPSLFSGLAHPDNETAYQEALAAKDAGKTVIGVIISGRPVLLEDVADTFDALVAVFLPGSEGGNALSDLLFGDADFKGRLSFTWPATTAFFSNRTAHVLYPFGYGLSYDEPE